MRTFVEILFMIVIIVTAIAVVVLVPTALLYWSWNWFAILWGFPQFPTFWHALSLCVLIFVVLGFLNVRVKVTKK